MLYNLVRGPQVCQLFSCYVSPSINKVLIIIIIIKIALVFQVQHYCLLPNIKKTKQVYLLKKGLKNHIHHLTA